MDVPLENSPDSRLHKEIEIDIPGVPVALRNSDPSSPLLDSPCPASFIENCFRSRIWLDPNSRVEVNICSLDVFLRKDITVLLRNIARLLSSARSKWYCFWPPHPQRGSWWRWRKLAITRSQTVFPHSTRQSPPTSSSLIRSETNFWSPLHLVTHFLLTSCTFTPTM